MAGTGTSTESIISSAAAGVTGGYDGDNLALKFIIVFFAGLTVYNSLELVILVLSTFNRYAGLYFWSLLVASLGLIPYAVGFGFKFFRVLPGDANWLSVSFLTLGWYAMVTGQSVVLWSRLHLLVDGDRGTQILKYTKWIIICNVFLLHLPTTVVTFGSNGRINTATFVQAYDVIEKFQMTGFFIQEVILSSIYIIETVKMLRNSLRPQVSRSLMHQLICINIMIVLMDVALLSMECASLFLLETILKGFTYSIKLKLEFAILSRLVKFVGGQQRSSVEVKHARSSSFLEVGKSRTQGSCSGDVENISDFVDLTKVRSDYTHARSEHAHNCVITKRPVDEL